MAKKKRKQKPRKSAKKKSENSPVVDRCAMETSLSDMGKILSEKEFASIDEANAFYS